MTARYKRYTRYTHYTPPTLQARDAWLAGSSPPGRGRAAEIRDGPGYATANSVSVTLCDTSPEGEKEPGVVVDDSSAVCRTGHLLHMGPAIQRTVRVMCTSID